MISIRSLWQVPIKTIFFCLFFSLLQAEPPISKLAGRVVDQSGATLAGAKLILSAPGREAITSSTDRSGNFEFSLQSYLAGSYKLRVQAEGFFDAERTVSLKEIAGARIEIMLGVAGSVHTITVTEKSGYTTAATTTATKTPTELLDIPQSISVINVEQMRDQAMMSMADVVRYVPGIGMAQGEGHRDAPIIRGNTSTADFFVNGVRDDAQYYRDLYNLERVEALKGPNAMMFGRGGGGGVLNRVTKEAGFTPLRELSVQGGSFGNKRVLADIDQPLNRIAAFRLNSMFEDSGSFRQYGSLRRYGVSPTLTLIPTQSTKLRLSYEYFHDGRVVDRGVPSYRGVPSTAERTVFFGNPDQSKSSADVHLGSAVVEQQIGGWNLRNQTLFGAYDKFYGNVFPGAVNADQTMVSLSAYDTATQRNNLFNQTDAVRNLKTGPVRHTLLVGSEFGRQVTDNLRNTGYFGNATTLSVPFSSPTVFTAAGFRQSASDAHNSVRNTVSAAYVQDQIQISRFVQIVSGLRFDRFDLSFANLRNDARLRRVDNMVSPRAGIVIKPITSLSLYGNYSVSFLPSAGDQFASLTATSQTLKPEKFTNYEIGAKWDLARGLSLSSAIYLLDRTNTSAVHPNNPALIVQTGAQRSKGLELGFNGRLARIWTIAGGYARQDAVLRSATTAGLAGARVPQVPQHTFSLWNHYRILPRLGAGFGLIHQADMFAAIDNSVRLPAFTRADAAVFYSLTEKLRLQANIENVLDTHYYVSAHSNNNISPGSKRALRIGLNVRF